MTTVFAASLFSSFATTAEMPPVGKIVWREYTPEAFAELREKRQATLVFCRADWCVTCQKMEAGALKGERLRAFVVEHEIAMIKADYTDNSELVRSFMKTYNVNVLPTVLYFRANRGKGGAFEIEGGATTEAEILQLLGDEPASEEPKTKP